MARCNNCFSITTKSDVDCYVCGEPVQEVSGWRAIMRFLSGPKPQPDKAATRDAILRRLEEAPGLQGLKHK